MPHRLSLLLLLLPACSPAQAPELPFEFDGHIFFHATINGDTARLLYDPVDGVMLDRAFVLRRPGWHRTWRDIGYATRPTASGGGPDEVEVSFADSVVVELGTMRRHFPRVPVIPLDSMLGDAAAGQVDGLLGTTVFHDVALHLDFTRQRARLLDPDNVDTTGWQVLPLLLTGARASTMIAVTWPDGSRDSLRTQVDLGMSSTLRISTREVNARSLTRHATSTTPDTLGRGLGGTLQSLRVDGARIEIGGLASEPTTIWLAREPTGADADPPYDALLGLGVLSRFEVIYDPGRGRMLVR